MSLMVIQCGDSRHRLSVDRRSIESCDRQHQADEPGGAAWQNPARLCRGVVIHMEAVRIKGRCGRVAHPLPVESATTVGARSFAHVAKGGYPTVDGLGLVAKLIVSTVSYPPLQKAQGDGAPTVRIWKGRSKLLRVGHPPDVLLVPAFMTV